MSEFDFDLFTIGAGSGGVAASRRAGLYGAKVGICEASRVGGTCVLRGCVPKKLLVYGSHFHEEIDDARAFGWTIPEAHLDWNLLIEKKNKELTRLEGVYQKLLRDSNVTVVEGRGTVIDPHTVEVNGKRFTAKNILIATGGRPIRPPIEGQQFGLTSDDVLELRKLPSSIVIIGGGYIGVEFSGILNNAGVSVSLLERTEHVLNGFDRDVRQTLTDQLRTKGINIQTTTLVTKVTQTENSKLQVHTNQGTALTTDAVLYAVGRSPNTQSLGLEQVGITLTPQGAIPVDAYSQSKVPSIYAVGDVTNRLALTPVAIAEGRALVETLFRNRPMKVDHRTVASAVFSQPPIGTVGLSEEEARLQYPSVDIYRTKFRPMKHTITQREERTMMKLIVDATTDRVLGCHMVGADAPEIIQGFAVALTCGATKTQFDVTVGIHPTAAEEFVTLRDKVPST